MENLFAQFANEFIVFLLGLLGVLLLYLRGKSRLAIRAEEMEVKTREVTLQYFMERIKKLEFSYEEMIKHSHEWEARFSGLFDKYSDLRVEYVKLQTENTRLRDETMRQREQIKKLYQLYNSSVIVIQGLQKRMTELNEGDREK